MKQLITFIDASGKQVDFIRLKTEYKSEKGLKAALQKRHAEIKDKGFEFLYKEELAAVAVKVYNTDYEATPDKLKFEFKLKEF